MENKRKDYKTLSVVWRSVELSSSVLAMSVVNSNTKVRTTGQEVKDYNFEDVSFNQVWE